MVEVRRAVELRPYWKNRIAEKNRWEESLVKITLDRLTELDRAIDLAVNKLPPRIETKKWTYVYRVLSFMYYRFDDLNGFFGGVVLFFFLGL